MSATGFSLATLRVLRAMLNDPLGMHFGAQLIKATGVQSGSLYPMLRALEQQGFLESHWEDIDEVSAGRRKRRYYQLTPDGRVAAEEVIEETVSELLLPADARPKRRRVPHPNS